MLQNEFALSPDALAHNADKTIAIRRPSLTTLGLLNLRQQGSGSSLSHPVGQGGIHGDGPLGPPDGWKKPPQKKLQAVLKINQKRKQMDYQHAIVIGSSIGGLLAARALADFFTQVTLLERDLLPREPENRRGVPQGRHAHGLLPTGLSALEGFFPGLRNDLTQRGAVPCNLSSQFLRFLNGGYHCQFPSDRAGILASRPLLEGYVRERVRKLPNVQIVENVTARGLVVSAGQSAVTGVRLVHRAKGQHEEVLASDLLVDASGRGSRSPHWLKANGFAAPPEQAVDIGLNYVTRHFRRQSHHLAGNLGASIPATPTNPTSGAILAQEGDRWIVSLAFYFNRKPPTDAAGFVEAARQLAAPDIYRVVRDAEALDEPATFHSPSNLRRRYERLKAFPQGYLVFGDAICSYNPVYGQGMTVTTLEAKALQVALAGNRDRLANWFFRAAAKVVANPWTIVVGNDLQLRRAQEHRWVGFLPWYVDRVQVAARRDAVVANAFQEVSELVSPPLRLLQPKLAARVLAGNARKTVSPMPLQRSLPISRRADAPTRSVIVRGVRSPLIDLGARSDEAVVFVHGNPGSRLDWLELATRVSEFGRAVAVDMPGFGQADKPRDFPYHVGAYAHHLEGVLAHLGVRRCHLVLHDFGGLWGLVWAAHHPHAVRSVALMNTGVPWSYSWHVLARLWRTPVAGELFMACTSRLSFEATVRFREPQKLPRAFINQMYQHLDQETRRVILEVYRRTTDLESLARWLHQALRPLDLPTLVIWGQRDPYLPASLAERQKETFPRAQVHGLANSGHWPFIDAPSIVAEKLVGFLRFHLPPYESETEREVPQSIGV